MEEVLTRWLGTTASLRTEIVAAIGLVLTFGVSVHVLLRKRVVGAAIGWIGLAWLAPVFGTLLYLTFGINRVERRARRLKRRPSQTTDETPQPSAHVPEAYHALDLAVQAVTGLPTVAGNRFELLRNGDEAYPAMLAAIGEARRSVALSSYIFRDDATGRAFCAALKAAQDRGAEVRVILDGIGSGYFFPAAWRHLRRLGVPAGLFMHSVLPWRMPFLNLRTHKKLLIVDGRVAFTGGVNIADGNRVSEKPDFPIRDTHFRIEGPVVEHLTQAFIADWLFVSDEELEGEAWLPRLAPVGTVTARVVTSGPDADIEKIATVVLQAIACAKASIRLTTPYFLPNELVLNALSLAAARGIAVDIAIPRKSDHRFVDWATHGHIDPLLKSGVRVWIDEPPFDHSKAMTVDGQWCFIGSANWDSRSFRLNFELNVEVYDVALARALEAFIATKFQTPLRLADLDARSLPVRLRDAAVRLLLPYL
ncbi:phospholipase D-like domain-containing protein [Methylorubrum extorquens]|uniref:phospholipase D-like domain-containing protein n=1 Tax=Methylorubrum extorquens TaxID=408 RepID=UPI000158FE68|nr:phospholipase D-like domain-containing protein [Methylorubrum extorquens]ABY32806.1 phospholipase D/Transphosphatidylase [Methylorubrum extorquens PA1]KQP86056.1 cardiolipin synthase [Methylobacterium sp. Leaf119]WIU39399.1 cardiolipin synthase [Methylorubrum extorquens]